MHSVESRFVIGPSNNTVWRGGGGGGGGGTFQPGNCTSCGSEGVNYENNGPSVQLSYLFLSSCWNHYNITPFYSISWNKNRK